MWVWSMLIKFGLVQHEVIVVKQTETEAISMGLIHKSQSRLRSKYACYINCIISVLRSAVRFTLYREAFKYY